jgi:phospholipase A-2-activating protein
MLNSKGFFTGGDDCKIYAIDLVGNPLLVYEGHSKIVNSLSQCVPNEVVSGSWDGTARVWDVETGKCKHILADHTHAVCTAAFPDGLIVTGSQDKQINLWKDGKKILSFKAHEDIIREIKPIGELGFASCSNDESIKLWDLKGNLLQTMKGHNGFVYALGRSPSGEILSGSEDNTVKTWKNGAFTDSITHPGTIWSLTTNQSGDIITACEDKTVRVFTRDTKRAAPELIQQEYKNKCVAKSAK